MIVSWFSAGVSSAVATKLALLKHPDMRIIYTHIDDQHEDTMRFLSDCEKWFDKKIEVLQSELKTVENACFKARWINGQYSMIWATPITIALVALRRAVDIGGR